MYPALRLFTFFVPLWIACLSDAKASDQYVGLVIANSEYPSQSLRGANAGAQMLVDALEEKGFEVVFSNNPSFFEFRNLIAEHGNKAAAAELSVFYYAGHAITLSDNNYLGSKKIVNSAG